MVAQAAVGVVAAGVDVGAVDQQVEGVIEVGAGVGVLAVMRRQAAVDLVEFARDPVLFSFEECERDGVGVVGLHEPFLLVFEAVAVPGELVEFLGFGGEEPVELVADHSGEGVAACGGDLDALVVVLDEVFHVFDEDRLPGAVGAFGVAACADEVGVDVAVPVLRVRHDEPGPA
ncbi:hypothetical protein [Kocuria rhizophila]|uniref:hypothetical protein n=1 Tax=Kocuria rhizophila TaxID=72000 RepID=UPI001E525EE8|nr:hypothetical protein [Kocuria rhizophila]